MPDDVLGPVVAGTWYPASKVALEDRVDELLALEPESEQPAPLALIAPHAGFEYSGPVAAAGFRLLQGVRPSRVVLIGPSHHSAFRGAAVPSASRYRTPLGEVPIESEAVRRLADRPSVQFDDEPFYPEHSLEAEIPFLQRLLPDDFRLVPVLIGSASDDDSLGRAAEALATLLDAETLVVISSDFTHYGPRFRYVPFEEQRQERIEALDRGAIEQILALDRLGFDGYVKRTGATICGRAPIDVLLRLLPDATEAGLVAYDTSGRITGYWDHSVSYASLVFRGSDGATW